MQKRNYFIYSILILFFSLFISSCQDSQKDIEDEKKEDEISCFANRINTYNENGELTRYSNRGYRQDKKMLYDSTFRASDNSLIILAAYTYDGDNYIDRYYQVFDGRLILFNEGFYEKGKMVKIKFYDFDGSFDRKSYTYTGELLTKIESYDKNDVLMGITINEYEGKNKTKIINYDKNNKLQQTTKYEYQSNVLIKEEIYNENNILTKYYVSTTQNNTTTRQAYDGQGNILVEKTIRRYDSNGNLIYYRGNWDEDDYQESNYTITYNEYGFITSHIFQSTTTTGTSLYQSYSKREYTDIQCY